MLAPWLLYAIVTSSLAAAGAVAAESLAGAWRRPRRGVWLAAIALSIGAPILVAFRPTARPDARAVSPTLVGDVRASDITNAILPPVVRTDQDRAARATITVSDRRLVQIWCVCSTSLIAFLLIGAMRLHRQAREWHPTVIDGVDVLVAPDAGPAVIGFSSPRVVLPAWTLTLDSPARALILRHELEHIRARDFHLLFFAAVATAMLPWNLALWFMARRLTLAVELDCDQRVLSATGTVREYGLMLLEVVRRRNVRGLLLGASLIRPRGFLARRIHQMVTIAPRRPRLISVVLVTSIAALTVAATRVPRPEPLRIGGAGARAMRVQLAHPVTTTSTQSVGTGPLLATAPQRSAPASLAREGPKPRITVNWENAPIAFVVDAFARFSGRTISLAPDVNGLVTARIDDEPWDEALAQVMALQGYRLVVHSDSSITIVAATPSRSENRRASGRVIDSSTNLPIVGAIVNVAGRQAIGEANRTCTTDGGAFELMVPDGEVWLDASARGYEFSRVSPAFFVAGRPKPLIIIDGAVVSPDRVDVAPCADR